MTIGLKQIVPAQIRRHILGRLLWDCHLSGLSQQRRFVTGLLSPLLPLRPLSLARLRPWAP